VFLRGGEAEVSSDSTGTESLLRYRTVVVDPPWEQPSGGPANSDGFQPGVRPSRLPYGTMGLAAIMTLDLDVRALREAQHLYLWTTNAHVEDAYLIARTWGFKPSQLLTWCKRPRGLGPGGVFATTTEFCLFAWRGSCDPLSRIDSTWFLLPRGAHSAKPEAFLDLVEQVSPGPYMEVFSRRARLGWDTWGNEALHGTGAAA
jgi:N6-adenosine-specific RNA methylase IME4